MTPKGSQNDISVSFEFFPPKSEKAETNLWETINRLEPVQPKFVSVTYGAGGSTRDRTHRTVKRMVDETGLTPAAHLTCVGASKSEVHEVAESYWQAGVKHIVALRGDPEEGVGAEFVPHPDGYASSIDLIAGLRAHRPELGKCFEVSVSAYPERHPESRGWDEDMALLKAKQDAGADRAITQFFFETDDYFRLLDRAHAAGITIPIVPGIMLQSNFKGLRKFAEMSGASVPRWLHDLYDGLENDAEQRDLITANVAADLTHKLADKGVKEFHFYTLNKAGLALSTCRLLGKRPVPEAAAA